MFANIGVFVLIWRLSDKCVGYSLVQFFSETRKLRSPQTLIPLIVVHVSTLDDGRRSLLIRSHDTAGLNRTPVHHGAPKLWQLEYVLVPVLTHTGRPVECMGTTDQWWPPSYKLFGNLDRCNEPLQSTRMHDDIDDVLMLIFIIAVVFDRSRCATSTLCTLIIQALCWWA